MREMKDSGIEWIGEIPIDWEVYKLRVLGNFTSSGIDKKINEAEIPVRIINYVDVYRNKKLLLQEKEYMIVTTTPLKKMEHQVLEGDLIFTPSSETVEDIGISALVDEFLPNTCFSYHVLRFQFKRNVVKNYKKYLCNNQYVLSYFSKKASGIIRKTLNRDDFKETKVILPPLPTQQRIADYLDKRCAKIDTIIEKTKATIEEYKKLKQSLITEAVTKGLNPNVDMKDSGIEFVGYMPEHWQVRRMKTLGKSRNGLTYKPENIGEENGTLVLRSSNVKNGKIKLDDNVYVSCQVSSELMVKKGDILICSRNGSRDLIGKNALIPENLDASFGAFMMIFRCYNYPQYLYYILNSNVFTYYLGTFFTATINQLTGYNFGNMKVPYCDDRFEQEQIVTFLDKKCSEIDQIIAYKKQQLEVLAEYKKSLIYEYVTGKREVI